MFWGCVVNSIEIIDNINYCLGYVIYHAPPEHGNASATIHSSQYHYFYYIPFSEVKSRTATTARPARHRPQRADPDDGKASKTAMIASGIQIENENEIRRRRAADYERAEEVALNANKGVPITPSTLRAPD